MAVKDIKLDTPQDIAELLDLEDFGQIYRLADQVRNEHMGDTVHMRAIIEFSNVCKRQCIYCGLNKSNREISRFRMSRREIEETARQAVMAGYRTVVLQSGEDDYFTAERLGKIVGDVKALDGFQDTGPPIVTLSCGELTREEYAYLKEKGADRYLLKHETADDALYSRLHPCGELKSRINCLRDLKEVGYETGSGFMIGLPGQSLETVGKDLLLLKELSCEMAGIGPFISNPKTPLAGEQNGSTELARRAVAIARLLLPKANLPVTTSLAILAPEENPFDFGANVIMKKVTPDEYKEAYEIYPAEYSKTNIVRDKKELEEKIRFYNRVPK
ncbi:MAG: [FeFe] hydrogenase H-cluster radical SAM maturase HydE [Clostridiales bacterium]|nr:[FeFe] hydrogenase H-cluster radical SAM maturase HydE [Clostridiales bacterium]